jgi:hypothetical protein
MIEPTTIAIDADELRLAQLACAKLAGLVQGALSVGLPAQVTGIPEPRAFLGEQFRVMEGFALVLHSVSGKAGSTQEILRLRERSREVMNALEDLRRHLFAHLDSPRGSSPTLHPARQAASALCDAIGEYGRLIQLDRSPIAKVKAVVMQVFKAVADLNAPQESPAG